MTDTLFKPAADTSNTFRWKDVKTFFVRSQYNELLKLVLTEYAKQYPPNIRNPKDQRPPKFLNPEICLTIAACKDADCIDSAYITSNTVSRSISSPVDTGEPLGLHAQFLKANNDFLNVQAEFEVAERTAKFTKNEENNAQLKEAANQLKHLKKLRETAEDAYQNSLKTTELAFENAKTQVENAKRNFNFDRSIVNEIKFREAEKTYQEAELAAKSASKDVVATARGNEICKDIEADYFCMPIFNYTRKLSLTKIPKIDGSDASVIDLTFNTNGLTVGALIWLYYYERMGIFKILGALMDDYNYRGKYTISGSRKDSKNAEIAYSALMDAICTLYRTGISSNQRDRICTYQRVLGVSIENNLGIDSEKNKGFMQTFSKLLDYMLEYYKAKQLATAINTGNKVRSSVATQTSIGDTINLLQQQFEPLQYGRNQINTFLGIATVHATLCLISMLRKEIGIPDQYDKPEEFIPAAYDILVAKSSRPLTLNETNRFIVFDNCATYGYRLLTDIETLDLSVLSTAGNGSKMDIWLDDVENLVEGYRNAYASVPEGVEAIV